MADDVFVLQSAKADAAKRFSPIGWTRPSGNGVIVTGDSLATYTSSASNGTHWFCRLCAISGQRLTYQGAFGFPGYTAQQWHDAAVTPILAMSPLPAAAIVMIGANDAGLGGSFSLASFVAPVKDALAKFRRAGIFVFLCFIPPRNSSTSDVGVKVINEWIRRYASTQNGVSVLDLNSPLGASSAAGGWQAGYDRGDGVHFSDFANRLIAEDLWYVQRIGDFFSPAPLITSKDTRDTSNLVRNGDGHMVANSAGKTLNWSNYGGGGIIDPTYSIRTPDPGDRLAGNWQDISRAAGDTGTPLFENNAITTGWSVGDRISFSGRFQASGFTANCPVNFPGPTGTDTGQTSYQVYVQFNGSTGPVVLWGLNTWDQDCDNGTFYAEGVIPASTVGLRIDVKISPVGSASPVRLSLGELTIRNLTTLGVITP